MSTQRLTIFGLLALVLLGAVWAVVPSAVVAAPQHGDHGGNTGRDRGLHGDRLVQFGLVQATVDVTGKTRREVQAALKSDHSIEAIAQAAGKTAADVLASFDGNVDAWMARAVSNDRLPQSVADARAAWFKRSARLQIDQPGLQPPFPGLHEVHALMITAAVQVSGLSRAEIKAQLESCATLSDSVAASGKTGQDVANQAMSIVDRLLQRGVESGRLSTAQRDEWRAALVDTTGALVNTPGLHVAGKQCAQ